MREANSDLVPGFESATPYVRLAAEWLIRRQPAGIINAFNDELLPFGLRVDGVTAEQTFGEQLAQIAFAGEMLRRCEDRIMQLAELDLDVAFLGDFQRVFAPLPACRQSAPSFPPPSADKIAPARSVIRLVSVNSVCVPMQIRQSCACEWLFSM